MRDCLDATIKDLLPDFVAGRLAEAERARVAAHVNACASCAAEVVVLRAAERVLGATPAVDIARIVKALPTPVVSLEARREARRPRRLNWRIAATVATIAVSGVSIAVLQAIVRDNGGHKPPVVAPNHRTAQATKVSDADQSGLAVGGSNLNDLTEGEMQALLAKLDQFDAVPSADPQPAVSGLRAATGVQ
jgi:anti-sigma factor RsiW